MPPAASASRVYCGPLAAALEAMDHEVQLLANLTGQATAKGFEEDVEIGEGIQPFVPVPGEGPLHAPAVDVEAGQVEGIGGGDEAEGRLHGLAAAVDAVDHPFQNPCVLAVARPQEAAFGVTPEPRSEERRVGKECRSRWSA